MNFIKRHFKFAFCVVWFSYLAFSVLDRPNFNKYELDSKLATIAAGLESRMNKIEKANIENLNDLREGIKKLALIQCDCQRSSHDDLATRIGELQNIVYQKL